MAAICQRSRHRACRESYRRAGPVYPEDRGRSDLFEDDRPYTGYNLANGFHTRWNRRRHAWEIRLGIVGAEARSGWNLPTNFGSCPIRDGSESLSAFPGATTHQTTFHFFLSTAGKAIARDIFLDGNTFADSPRDNKHAIVGEFMGGIAWQMGRVSATYSYTIEPHHLKLRETTRAVALSASAGTIEKQLRTML